jgi:formylmethanofuran dehydrogenase subunit E
MTKRKNYNDLPREELLKKAQEVMADYPPESKPEIHFKFTCQHCGERCTLSDANVLYEKGECYACGKETEITKGGFMLQFVLGLKE